MQAELKSKLGIESTIRVVEVANRGTEAREGTFDMILTVYLKSVTNDFVQAWNASFRTDASRNFAKYSNPEFDAIVDQILLEPDAEARKKLYLQGMDILDQDPPHYMLGFTKHNAIWRNELKGHFEEVRLFTVYNPPDTFWLDV
jgi:peptide/nickel transport system substrate-binding protein